MLESWAEAGLARFFTNPWLYPPSVLVPKDDLETTALLDLCSLHGTFLEENNDWYIQFHMMGLYSVLFNFKNV